MKNQKNMILVGVAVGFGLLAAVLVTQMNAKPADASIAEIDVPYAARDLPLNSQLKKEDFKLVVEYKKVPQDKLPPAPADGWVFKEEELVDKRVTRMMHKGEMFAKTDVSNKPTVEIPPGHDMVTFGINRERLVGGFAVPGSRVDLISTIRLSKSNSTITFPLFRELLILAVDTQVRPNQEGVQAQMGDVSVAVTKDMALMLHAALDRGANFRFLLLGQDKKGAGGEMNEYGKPLTRDEIWQVLKDTYEDKTIIPPGPPKEKDESKGAELIAMPVLKETLAPGTKLTDEVLDTKFGTLMVPGPAPKDMVQDIRKHRGDFLQKELYAGQFVPRSFVGDEQPKAEARNLAKPGPADGGDTRKIAPDAETAGPPPVYHDVTVQTTSGVKKFRYQKMPTGRWAYRGELLPGDDEPAPPAPSLAPKSKPSDKAAPADDAKTPDQAG